MRITNFILAAGLAFVSCMAAFGQVSNDVSRNVIEDAKTRPTLNASTTNFRLGGVFQTRYGYNNLKSGSDSYGFENSFLRLDLTGLVGESFSYKISPRAYSNGDLVLEDAYVAADAMDFKVMVGQFKPQFASENSISTENINGPFRSVVSNTLGQGYTQGVQVSRNWEYFGAALSFTDGNRMDNTAINSANNSYGLNARMQLAVWNGLGDSTNFVLGGGIMHEENLDTFTVDANWKPHTDWNVNAAYFYSQVSNGHPFVTENTYNALTGEVSYNFNSSLQVYAKHEFGHADNASDLNISHVGVNYFLVERVVRWNNDVGFSYGELNPTWNYNRTGFVSGERQIVLSSQLQILF